MYKADPVAAEDITKYELGENHAVECIITDGLQQPLYEVTSGVVPDFRRNLARIREMESKTGDIYICAYPKAGTHWTWEITHMLLRGSTDYEKVSKENYGLEFHEPSEFQNMESPRVFNSHLPFRCLPKRLKENNCKVIFIQRNPKDVAVSFFNHTKKIDHEYFDGTWEQYLKLFLKEQVYYQGWFTYTLEWEKALVSDRYSVLSLYYEDMKKNPVAEIKKIAQFLDCNHSEELLEKIADKCNFNNMKNANKDKSYTFGDSQTVSLGEAMFRKGITGDWKNWFTVAQNEEFDRVYKDKMADSTFTYCYC